MGREREAPVGRVYGLRPRARGSQGTWYRGQESRGLSDRGRGVREAHVGRANREGRGGIKKDARRTAGRADEGGRTESLRRPTSCGERRGEADRDAEHRV